MINPLSTEKPATHTATLNGETVSFNVDDYDSVVSEFVSRVGGGVPKIEKIEDAVEVVQARREGFSPVGPAFTVGRELVEDKSEKAARRLRQAFEKLPLARDAFETFAKRVDSEGRRDRIVHLSNLRMNHDGTMTVRHNDRIHDVMITERAFSQLVAARLNIGGGAYLAECWPSLRAYNVNQWLERMAVELPGDSGNVVLRIRNNEFSKMREIFAAVTEKYQGGLDAARIARSLALATPEDARGEVVYTAESGRVRFDTLFGTNTTHYETREVFRAGASITADDTGAGSIVVTGMVERHACLNLALLVREKDEVAKIRHVGSLSDLVTRFEGGYETALEATEGFQKAWGYASAEKVLEGTAAASGESLETLSNMSVTDVLSGIFWAQLRRDRELVPAVRGSRKQVVNDLVISAFRDPIVPSTPRDITRSHVINAWTRYAHETASSDPWVEDSIERAASTMLPGNGGKARPLPYEAFPR